MIFRSILAIISLIIILFLLIIIFNKLKKKNYNIHENQNNINISEIKNLQNIIDNIPDCPVNIDFNIIMPSHLTIYDMSDNEWGLKVNKYFKRGEIIHKTPISFFSQEYKTKIITPIGEK